MTTDRLREIADSLSKTGSRLLGGTGWQLQFAARDLRIIAGQIGEHEKTVTAEVDRLDSLTERQQAALKDLTASSEKLRALNRACIQKAVLQGSWISILEGCLERKSKQLDACLADNQRLSETSEVRRRVMLELDSSLLELVVANATARPKLEQVVRLATEVLTGQPAREGSMMHIVYEPDCCPSA